MQKYIGVVFILLAACSWGMLGVTARFLFRSGLEPLELAFWRAIFGGLLFSAVAVAGNRARPGLCPRSWLRLARQAAGDIFGFALFGVFVLAALFLCYMTAIELGGVALAVVLQYTAPAWVAIFSRIFFREPLTAIKCVAVLASLAGVSLVSFAGASGPSTVNALGIIFGLLAGVIYAAQYIVTKKLVASHSIYTIFGYSFLFAALALLPFVDFVEKSPADCGVLCILGVACTFFPFLCYAAGLQRVDASIASVIATIEPVIAATAAWLIWDERFTPLGLVGMALVIGAVVVLVAVSKPQAPAGAEDHLVALPGHRRKNIDSGRV